MHTVELCADEEAKENPMANILLCSERRKKDFIIPDVTSKFQVTKELCNLWAALLLMQIPAAGAGKRPDLVCINTPGALGSVWWGPATPAHPAVTGTAGSARWRRGKQLHIRVRLETHWGTYNYTDPVAPKRTVCVSRHHRPAQMRRTGRFQRRERERGGSSGFQLQGSGWGICSGAAVGSSTSSPAPSARASPERSLRAFPPPPETLFPSSPSRPFAIALHPDLPWSTPPVWKGTEGAGVFLPNPEQFRIQENPAHPAVGAETVFRDTLHRRKAEADRY